MTNKTPDNQTNRLPRPRRREFPAPLTEPLTGSQGPRASTPLPPAPAPEPYYEDEYEEYDGYYQPQRESLLRNPYVLAAIAVVGAILMAVVVVAMAGGGGGGGNAAMTTPNPLTPQPAGATVDSISTATVRDGPGTEYNDLGVLSRGQKVNVTGRDGEGKWFQIVFPQNSTSRGWVPASALKISEINLGALAIVTVTPRPTAVLPTQPPLPTEVATATATATGTAVPGPDLAIAIGSCAAGAPLQVTISNVGDSPVTGRTASISVSIGGQVRATSQAQLTINPNESVTFPTNEVATAPSTSVLLTLQGSPADIDTSDNSAQCQLSSGTTTPTAAPGTTTTPSAATPTRTPTVQTQQP